MARTIIKKSLTFFLLEPSCSMTLCCSLQEIDVFVQEFLSVVQRLPSCISTLHALSRLPMPSTFSELQNFCSTNEAKFQQLRRSGLSVCLSVCLAYHHSSWQQWPMTNCMNISLYVLVSRELGLDELLKHCESVVEKLRYPEKDPCYQAMAGTALFTHTAFDMLQNHSR